MAARKNVYEQQARLSVLLAAVGALCTLTALALMLQRFRWDSFQIVYDPRSMRMVAIGGALGLGLVGGGVSFLLGWLSAGRKTNPLNRLSWTGFFLGAGVIAAALCCGVFFLLTRFPYAVRIVAG